MGKKDKKPSAVADTAADIDDIFAAPKKVDKPSKASKSSSSAKDKSKSSDKSSKDKSDKKEKKDKSEKSEKKDKADKKRKSEAEEPAKKKSKSERVVEEVVDPSLAVKAAVEKAKQKPAPSKTKRGKEVEEDMAFRDSRGDAGREYILSPGCGGPTCRRLLPIQPRALCREKPRALLHVTA